MFFKLCVLLIPLDADHIMILHCKTSLESIFSLTLYGTPFDLFNILRDFSIQTISFLTIHLIILPII